MIYNWKPLKASLIEKNKNVLNRKNKKNSKSRRNAVRAFEHERTLGCRDVVAEAIKLLLLPAHLFCGEFVEIFLPTEAQ